MIVSEADSGTRANAHGATLSDAFRIWLKIGLLSFGGPAGQIALMHRIVVDEKRWLGESRFLHALNYCMLLPGPEAQQLAIYIGWLLHRTLGGLMAGVLFVLPGAIVILVLSILYVLYGDQWLVQALFLGVKAAVFAVVIEAVGRIGRRVLKSPAMVMISFGAFVAIFLLDLPFPLIVASAALLGLTGGRYFPSAFLVDDHAAGGEEPKAILDVSLSAGGLDHTRPSLRRALKVIVVCVVLWLGPTALLAALLGSDNVFAQEGLFFSKLAVVTFGGAYAVLAYIAQQAVSTYGWLQPGEMLDGLGLAETTPGPLIMVAQFVGFLGAFRNAGTLDPILAGVLGAALTTWVTFVPCFLWIFLGAPYIERLRNNRALSAALSAITASVVGVILNLALWFGVHVLFEKVAVVRILGIRLLSPDWTTLSLPALALAAIALASMFRYRLGVVRTLTLCAGVGVALSLLTR